MRKWVRLWRQGAVTLLVFRQRLVALFSFDWGKLLAEKPAEGSLEDCAARQEVGLLGGTDRMASSFFLPSSESRFGTRLAKRASRSFSTSESSRERTSI